MALSKNVQTLIISQGIGSCQKNDTWMLLGCGLVDFT